MTDNQNGQPNVFDKLKAFFHEGLSVFSLQKAGEFLAKEAYDALPGATGPEKKQWAKDHLLAEVEQYDNMIPVVGQFLDLTFVDGMEKAACDIAVEKGWAVLLAEMQAPVTNDPAQQPGGIEQ